MGLFCGLWWCLDIWTVFKTDSSSPFCEALIPRNVALCANACKCIGLERERH